MLLQMKCDTQMDNYREENDMYCFDFEKEMTLVVIDYDIFGWLGEHWVLK